MKFPEVWRVTSASRTPGRRRDAIGQSLETDPGDREGLFILPAVVPGRPLRCIVSTGLGWEHVSVSIETQPTKLPTWPEMDAVKRAFWDDEDAVMQLHPPRSKHRSIAEVLHLWRPSKPGVVIPLPPDYAVAPKSPDELIVMADMIAAGASDDDIRAMLEGRGGP